MISGAAETWSCAPGQRGQARGPIEASRPALDAGSAKRGRGRVGNGRGHDWGRETRDVSTPTIIRLSRLLARRAGQRVVGSASTTKAALIVVVVGLGL